MFVDSKPESKLVAMASGTSLKNKSLFLKMTPEVHSFILSQ